MRRTYIEELHPPPVTARTIGDEDPTTHNLRSLSSKHPLCAFEAQMREFLAALLDTIPKPLLVQLERGGSVEIEECSCGGRR